MTTPVRNVCVIEKTEDFFGTSMETVLLAVAHRAVCVADDEAPGEEIVYVSMANIEISDRDTEVIVGVTIRRRQVRH